MKKCSVLLLVCLLMALLLPVSAQAATANALVLPSSTRTIAAEAFRNDTSVQIVALPKGLLSIGSYAFASSGLKSINLPNTITSIADNAFASCSSGLTVSATPGSYAYNWCVSHGITLGQTITPGTATATIRASGETVLYRFVPSSSGKYTLTSTGSDDTYGYLYDASGNELVHNDDGGDNRNFSITASLTAGSVYYFEVRFYGGTKTGSINLILAQNISLGNTTATISTAGKRVRFLFAPSASGSYTLKSTGSDDTYGYLYDASGSELAHDDDGGDNRNFNITYTLTGGSIYYYEVRFYDSSKTGRINLVLSKASDVRYRALLIGNDNYSGNPLSGCINDMNAMAAMLSGLGNSFTCTKRSDVTASQIRSAISSAFSGATANDVSLFYYSGHGLTDGSSSGTGSSNGALCGVDHSYLYLSDLASALSNVSGRVIVVMDSCRSGAAIGKAEEDEQAANEAFNQCVLDAFADYDTYIENDAITDGETDPDLLKYGELAKSKFIVFTACRANQDSTELSSHRGLFTYHFVAGCGCTYGYGTCSGTMPADTDRNNKLTVSEIYTYTKDQVNSYKSSQTPQYYASSTSEVLFSR